MSRTYKKPYTKAKAVDSHCRNHGTCPYCKNNRIYNTLKKLEATNINR